MKYRTALTSGTTEPHWWGPLIVGEDEFDAMERALLAPQEPTESIKRGAELLRQLYGKKTGNSPDRSS